MPRPIRTANWGTIQGETGTATVQVLRRLLQSANQGRAGGSGGANPFTGINNPNTPAAQVPLRLYGNGPQLYLSHDGAAGRQASFDADSSGNLTVTLTGTTPEFTLANNVNIAGDLTVTKTTDQLKLAYDASNHVLFTVSSGGEMTVTPSGHNSFFTGDITIGNAGDNVPALHLGSAAANTNNVIFFSSATHGLDGHELRYKAAGDGMLILNCPWNVNVPYASTNTVEAVASHRRTTTGTPAAGIGARYTMLVEKASSVEANTFRRESILTDASASHTSATTWSTWASGSQIEYQFASLGGVLFGDVSAGISDLHGYLNAKSGDAATTAFSAQAAAGQSVDIVRFYNAAGDRQMSLSKSGTAWKCPSGTSLILASEGNDKLVFITASGGTVLAEWGTGTFDSWSAKATLDPAGRFWIGAPGTVGSSDTDWYITQGDEVWWQNATHMLDGKYAFFGTGNDSKVGYDGSNLYLWPKLVGTGVTINKGNFYLAPAVAGHALLRIRCADNTSSSQIHFGDSASANPGRFEYNHTSNSFIFYVSASGKMRLSSSELDLGNVGSLALTFREMAAPGTPSSAKGQVYLSSVTNELSITKDTSDHHNLERSGFVLQSFVDVKERNLQYNLHGLLENVVTAGAVSSGSPQAATVGLGKIIVVVNAGADTAGTLTVTGTSVDRASGSETGSDTDALTIAGTTTDGTDTDAAGNTRWSMSNAYITSKWFTGVLSLSTTDVDLSDIDVYLVAFEQFNDNPETEIDTVDITAYANNTAAWLYGYLYKLTVSGDTCTVVRQTGADVAWAASKVAATGSFRFRRGGLDLTNDGTTDGMWYELHLGPLANNYWENINHKIWGSQPKEV
jgi:hypothetical protein